MVTMVTEAAELARLLREAIDAKSREVGARYTYRDLGRDSGIDFSYAAKVINEGRQPSREIIRAWARALRPYLPLDQALVAAGYLPDDPQAAGAMRRLMQRIDDARRRGERAIGEFFSDEKSQRQAAEERNHYDDGNPPAQDP